jgi:hypothetical protein|tara:strand:- start:3337 stop:3498 length:162 start_codon:yes stop_codon:yes gene_type:complete
MILDNNKILFIILIVAVGLIPYIIGQRIDGDNLFFDLDLKPFWQYQIRECPAC